MFNRVAILGLGLIGGSLGLALHEAKAANEIVGYDKGKGVGERAHAIGAIDIVYGSATEAVQGAELVILATPVGAVYGLLKEMAPFVATGTVVTDVASTKSQVLTWANELLPASVWFVGGHPMTGKETSGIEVADAALFQGCVYCVTPTIRTETSALNKVVALVEILGARIHYINAEEHDRQVASVSHLPFLASIALVAAITQDATWSESSLLAATGFQDMTRLAGGSPEMYRDICTTNSATIVAMLDAYVGVLKQMSARIQQQDNTLSEIFVEAKRLRDEWQKTRDFTE